MMKNNEGDWEFDRECQEPPVGWKSWKEYSENLGTHQVLIRVPMERTVEVVWKCGWVRWTRAGNPRADRGCTEHDKHPRWDKEIHPAIIDPYAEGVSQTGRVRGEDRKLKRSVVDQGKLRINVPTTCIDDCHHPGCAQAGGTGLVWVATNGEDVIVLDGIEERWPHREGDDETRVLVDAVEKPGSEFESALDEAGYEIVEMRAWYDEDGNILDLQRVDFSQDKWTQHAQDAESMHPKGQQKETTPEQQVLAR